jgi:6-phosphogluconolactonase
MKEIATMLLFIGTYTGSGSKGIYTYRFNLTTGELAPTGHVAETKNPTFLAIHPSQRFLYAVSEIGDFEGKPTGGVSAYAIDKDTGALTLLNQQESKGRGPCHVSVDASGKYVLVANYGSGSVAMLPVLEDGRLAAATCAIQHEGSSANPKRQEGPHAHSITPDAGNRYAFACDLGIDKVMIYKLDLAHGKLLPNEPPFVPAQPGAGPRHFDFHPDGKYAYLLNELNATLTAFAYDAATGALVELQTVPTLPPDYAGFNLCADVHVHPNGRFVYASNRGHNSLVIYAIDGATGKLTFVDRVSSGGEAPRNFAIDPSGKFLLAANQDTGNLVVFRIDPETGKLSPTGHEARVPKPVCLKMSAGG